MPKHNNYFEFIVGTFVLLCAALFLISSMRTSNTSSQTGYSLLAKFDNVDGIKNGSDVKISGIKVGAVDNQFIDEKSYRATIRMNIAKHIKIPTDSSIKIASEGLLGSKYLAISPGSADEILADGNEISYTQSSVNFEELLGKFIFGNSTKSSKN